MTPENQRKLRALIKRYHIYFDRLSDPEHWPLRHSQTFSNITKLAKTEFAQYRESVTIDSAEKPWGDQTRCRAERIASLARRCLDGRKNEAGWRMSLESEILARFTVEVACRKCRARLWRSEVEAAASALDGFRDSLEERRKKRKPCCCSSASRREDPFEGGINPLFDDRAQEAILHEDPLKSEMSKREEPDRIYGLRKTKKFERVLSTEDKRLSSGGKRIDDTIKSSPFRPDGESIVFPFLVLEAKSEKGQDGFSDIEAQTALTIRTLLNLQEDLRKSTGEESEWETGPLVWSLSNKGEQWRIGAAYVDYEKDIRSYHVVDLWDGRIISNEGALRLLLIVDYIFDWARDVYREAIFGELRRLAVNDTPSLARDSDVLSALDPVPDFWLRDMESKLEDPFSNPKNEIRSFTPENLRTWETTHGTLRDARDVQPRFMALYITEDNISLLMQSLDTVEESQKLAESILRRLKESWRLTRETLDELELMWTGKDRENGDLFSPDKIFFVVTTITVYLTSSWEQIRELSYLAVSEAAIESLLQYAKLEKGRQIESSAFPGVGKSVYVGYFEGYLNGSIRDNLLAAISRACRSTRIFARKGNDDAKQDVFWLPSIEEVKDGVKYRMDAAVVRDRNAHARELVSSLYSRHKIGRSEPSLSFIRVSSRWDHQDQDSDPFPQWEEQDLSAISGQRFLSVISQNPNNSQNNAELCIFLLCDSQESISKIDGLSKAQWKWQFQARRLDSKGGRGRVWNDEDIKTEDPRFPRMFESLLIELKKKLTEASKSKGSAPRFTSSKRWESKSVNSEVHLDGPEPASFDVILDIHDQLLSQGTRITSVIDKQPSGFASKFQGSEYANFLAAPTVYKDVSRNPKTTSSTESRFEQSKEILNVKAEKRRQANKEKDSMPNREEKTRVYGIVNGWGIPPRKRGSDERSEDPSSLVSSSKRRNVGSTTKFSRDFLSQEELDRLLSEGRFD